MIEEIKELYSQINEKSEFITKLAIKLEKQPGSLQTNWFSRFWSIPKHYQAEVLGELKKEINRQNKKNVSTKKA